VLTQVVTYSVDESTTVGFEVELPEGFRPAGGPEEILGRVREAVTPAVEAARAIVEQIRKLEPGQAEVRFGIKVSGGAHWLVAKAAAEANFEVTLTWTRPAETGKASGSADGDGH
jgi:hypothetical protein